MQNLLQCQVKSIGIWWYNQMETDNIHRMKRIMKRKLHRKAACCLHKLVWCTDIINTWIIYYSADNIANTLWADKDTFNILQRLKEVERKRFKATIESKRLKNEKDMLKEWKRSIAEIWGGIITKTYSGPMDHKTMKWWTDGPTDHETDIHSIFHKNVLSENEGQCS